MLSNDHEHCDECGMHKYNCWCYPANVNVCECAYQEAAELEAVDYELDGQEALSLDHYDRSADDGIICFPSGPCPVKWCRRVDPHMHADSGIVPVPD